MVRKFLQKAPLVGAFCLFWLPFSLAAAELQRCPVLADGLRLSAKRLYVVDGDTLHGLNGERYRLIGVNTPELGHDREGRRKESEPLAEPAAGFVRDWLVTAGRLRLVPGKQPRDRYRRRLVYVYSAGGELLADRLIRAGLGFQVAIPPNIRLNECLAAAEREARADRRGIWADDYYRPRPATSLVPDDAGFRRVSGRVERVEHGRPGFWLEMKGDLVLRLRAGVLADPGALAGRTVLVRGWLIDRAAKGGLESGRARYMIDIPHESSIQVQ